MNHLAALRTMTCLGLALGLPGAGVARAAPATPAPVPLATPAGPAPRFSLAEAQRLAFERNWDLLAAKSGIDAATAQLILVKEFPNPTVSLLTARVGTRENGTFLGNGIWSRNYDTIAAVSQLLEIAGKRRNRQASARAGVHGARARFFDARRTLDQGVTKAYVAALLAQENVRVLNDSAASLRHEAQIAEARFKAGDISESDLRQIQNNADVFELQAKSAEAAAVQARVAVEVLMGVAHPTGQWTPTDSLAQLSYAPAPAPPELPEAARPDVLAAQADLRRSDADLRLQKALRIPDPTVTVQAEHNPPGGGPPVDTFGFGVSFPLPIWNRNQGGIKAAEAARDQAALALEKLQAQVLADVISAETAYQEARQRLERYQAQIQPKAAKVRESVAYAYAKGGASLVDLLTAERDDNSVRLATAQALSDTASAAADLKAAQTVIPETELNSPQ